MVSARRLCQVWGTALDKRWDPRGNNTEETPGKGRAKKAGSVSQFWKTWVWFSLRRDSQSALHASRGGDNWTNVTAKKVRLDIRQASLAEAGDIVKPHYQWLKGSWDRHLCGAAPMWQTQCLRVVVGDPSRRTASSAGWPSCCQHLPVGLDIHNFAETGSQGGHPSSSS